MKGKNALYEPFFEQLVADIRAMHEFETASASGKGNYRSFTSDTRGFTYAAVFPRRSQVRGEIYIEFGNRAENLAAFRAFCAKRGDLEKRFGKNLAWEELPGKQACRIALYRDGKIEDRQSLDEYRLWLVQTLAQFKRVFGK